MQSDGSNFQDTNSISSINSKAKYERKGSNSPAEVDTGGSDGGQELAASSPIDSVQVPSEAIFDKAATGDQEVAENERINLVDSSSSGKKSRWIECRASTPVRLRRLKSIS